MKELFRELFERALSTNNQNIVALCRPVLQRAVHPWICDLGCGNSALTEQIAGLAPGARVQAVEIHEPYVVAARAKGFDTTSADLNGSLPLPSDRFDLVVSNQVIEHVHNTDSFLSEAYRITKPGGTAVIATENAASWHNIFALLLGWQAFSLTNISDKRSGIGNPLAIHAGEVGLLPPMQHQRLYTLRALRDLFRLQGFQCLKTTGAGYHPLFPRLGRLDPNHSHFIAICGQKPAPSDGAQRLFAPRRRARSALLAVRSLVG